jgi:hypothetical protein
LIIFWAFSLWVGKIVLAIHWFMKTLLQFLSENRECCETIFLVFLVGLVLVFLNRLLYVVVAVLSFDVGGGKYVISCFKKREKV